MNLIRRAPMPVLFCAVALAGALCATVAAADVTGLYGSVVIGTFADGRQVSVRLHPDGSFDEILPDGSKAGGVFTDDARGVCLNETSPPTAPGDLTSECLPSLPGKKLGDSWDLPEAPGFKMRVVPDRGPASSG